MLIFAYTASKICSEFHFFMITFFLVCFYNFFDNSLLIFLFHRTTTIKISSVYNPSRWKAIKIVALTTGCFFITWCPYFLASALYVTCDNSDSAPSYCNNLRLAIASPLAILGLSNSLMNPIIYAWWHNGFRTSAKKLCVDLWQRSIVPLFRSLRRKSPKIGVSRQASKPKVEDDSTTGSTKASTSRTTSLSVESKPNPNMPDIISRQHSKPKLEDDSTTDSAKVAKASTSKTTSLSVESKPNADIPDTYI